MTVGTQFPFDRLIKAVDSWAIRDGTTDIVAQVGASAYFPKAIKTLASIPPAEFVDYQRRAKVIVSHAGMGGILSAHALEKPLIIMPRLARLGEHRNDHQLATVTQFRGRPGIHVTETEQGLFDLLDHVDTLSACAPIAPQASSTLIDALRSFMEQSADDVRMCRVHRPRRNSPGLQTDKR